MGEEGQNVAVPATMEDKTTPGANAEEEQITETTAPGETTEEDQIPEAAPDAPEVGEQIPEAASDAPEVGEQMTEVAAEEDQQISEPEEEETNVEIAPDAVETEQDQEISKPDLAESVPEKVAIDVAAPSSIEVVDETEEAEHASAEDITTQLETMEMAKVRATRKRVKASGTSQNQRQTRAKRARI